MGVNLGDLAVSTPMPVETLSGKIFAVDAYNTIYQFLSSIRQQDGTPLMDSKGKVTGHLSGLFYRNANLLEKGVKLVYVFDGTPPEFKKKTIAARAAIKVRAEENYADAKERGDEEAMKRYAQATSRLTKEMVEESKRLLTYMGIPVIQAPSEGEAQASELAREGKVFAAASQDFDALLFGAPLLLKNLSITGRRKVPRKNEYIMIEPELISLEETLKASGLTREQLILLGILVGTDFNEGVKGIGPKKGLKIVKEHKKLADIVRYAKNELKYEFPEDVEEIEQFFLHPPVEKNVGISFSLPDKRELVSILCDEHDFSGERVANTVENLVKVLSEKGKQSDLGKWF
jgi:flap endonuclease-1